MKVKEIALILFLIFLFGCVSDTETLEEKYADYNVKMENYTIENNAISFSGNHNLPFEENIQFNGQPIEVKGISAEKDDIKIIAYKMDDLIFIETNIPLNETIEIQGLDSESIKQTLELENLGQETESVNFSIEYEFEGNTFYFGDEKIVLNENEYVEKNESMFIVKTIKGMVAYDPLDLSENIEKVSLEYSNGVTTVQIFIVMDIAPNSKKVYDPILSWTTAIIDIEQPTVINDTQTTPDTIPSKYSIQSITDLNIERCGQNNIITAIYSKKGTLDYIIQVYENDEKVSQITGGTYIQAITSDNECNLYVATLGATGIYKIGQEQYLNYNGSIDNLLNNKLIEFNSNNFIDSITIDDEIHLGMPSYKEYDNIYITYNYNNKILKDEDYENLYYTGQNLNQLSSLKKEGSLFINKFGIYEASGNEKNEQLTLTEQGTFNDITKYKGKIYLTDDNSLYMYEPMLKELNKIDDITKAKFNEIDEILYILGKNKVLTIQGDIKSQQLIKDNAEIEAVSIIKYPEIMIISEKENNEYPVLFSQMSSMSNDESWTMFQDNVHGTGRLEDSYNEIGPVNPEILWIGEYQTDYPQIPIVYSQDTKGIIIPMKNDKTYILNPETGNDISEIDYKAQANPILLEDSLFYLVKNSEDEIRFIKANIETGNINEFDFEELNILQTMAGEGTPEAGAIYIVTEDSEEEYLNKIVISEDVISEGWRIEIDDKTISQPIITNDKIYLLTGNKLLSFDKLSGDKETVIDIHLIDGITYGNGGMIRNNSKLYIVLGKVSTGTPARGKFYSYDIETTRINGAVIPATFKTPAINGNKIIFSTPNGIYEMDALGRNEHLLYSVINPSEPIVDNAGNIYFTYYETRRSGQLMAVGLTQDGTLLFNKVVEFNPREIEPRPPTIFGGTLYVATDNNIYALRDTCTTLNGPITNNGIRNITLCKNHYTFNDDRPMIQMTNNAPTSEKVLDCNGATIEYTGTYASLYTTNAISIQGTNIKVKNCTLLNWGTAIKIKDSQDYNVSNNTIIGVDAFAGTGTSIGKHCVNILIESSTNGVVIDNNVSDCFEGIYLYGCSNNNLILNNEIHYNFYGISLQGSSYNTLTDNNLTFNYAYGLKMYGGQTACNECQNYIDTTNYAGWNNQPLYFYNANDVTHNINEAGEIVFCKVNNGVIKNIEISKSDGIQLHYSKTCRIDNVNIYEAWYGIYLTGNPIGSSNQILNSQFNNNHDTGITIQYENHDTIDNVHTINNGYTIRGSEYATFSKRNGVYINPRAGFTVSTNLIDTTSCSNQNYDIEYPTSNNANYIPLITCNTSKTQLGDITTWADTTPGACEEPCIPLVCPSIEEFHGEVSYYGPSNFVNYDLDGESVDSIHKAQGLRLNVTVNSSSQDNLSVRGVCTNSTLVPNSYAELLRSHLGEHSFNYPSMERYQILQNSGQNIITSAQTISDYVKCQQYYCYIGVNATPTGCNDIGIEQFTFVVRNRYPELTGTIAIEPTDTQGLLCNVINAGYYDPDDDPRDTTNYTWYQDGSMLDTTSNILENPEPGSTYECKVSMNDSSECDSRHNNILSAEYETKDINVNANIYGDGNLDYDSATRDTEYVCIYNGELDINDPTVTDNFNIEFYTYNDLDEMITLQQEECGLYDNFVSSTNEDACNVYLGCEENYECIKSREVYCKIIYNGETNDFEGQSNEILIHNTAPEIGLPIVNIEIDKWTCQANGTSYEDIDNYYPNDGDNASITEYQWQWWNGGAWMDVNPYEDMSTLENYRDIDTGASFSGYTIYGIMCNPTYTEGNTLGNSKQVFDALFCNILEDIGGSYIPWYDRSEDTLYETAPGPYSGITTDDPYAIQNLNINDPFFIDMNGFYFVGQHDEFDVRCCIYQNDTGFEEAQSNLICNEPDICNIENTCGNCTITNLTDNSIVSPILLRDQIQNGQEINWMEFNITCNESTSANPCIRNDDEETYCYNYNQDCEDNVVSDLEFLLTSGLGDSLIEPKLVDACSGKCVPRAKCVEPTLDNAHYYILNYTCNPEEEYERGTWEDPILINVMDSDDTYYDWAQDNCNIDCEQYFDMTDPTDRVTPLAQRYIEDVEGLIIFPPGIDPHGNDASQDSTFTCVVPEDNIIIVERGIDDSVLPNNITDKHVCYPSGTCSEDNYIENRTYSLILNDSYYEWKACHTWDPDGTAGGVNRVFASSADLISINCDDYDPSCQKHAKISCDYVQEVKILMERKVTGKSGCINTATGMACDNEKIENYSRIINYSSFDIDDEKCGLCRGQIINNTEPDINSVIIVNNSRGDHIPPSELNPLEEVYCNYEDSDIDNHVPDESDQVLCSFNYTNITNSYILQGFIDEDENGCIFNYTNLPSGIDLTAEGNISCCVHMNDTGWQSEWSNITCGSSLRYNNPPTLESVNLTGGCKSGNFICEALGYWDVDNHPAGTYYFEILDSNGNVREQHAGPESDFEFEGQDWMTKCDNITCTVIVEDAPSESSGLEPLNSTFVETSLNISNCPPIVTTEIFVDEGDEITGTIFANATYEDADDDSASGYYWTIKYGNGSEYNISDLDNINDALVTNEADYSTNENMYYNEVDPVTGGMRDWNISPMVNLSELSSGGLYGIDYIEFCAHARDSGCNYTNSSVHCSRIPGGVKSREVITNCTTITSQGTYYLGNDILVRGTLPLTTERDGTEQRITSTVPNLQRDILSYGKDVYCCIIIDSNNVDLDLNGKTIALDNLIDLNMNPTLDLGGICINTQQDINIENGTTNNWDRGITAVKSNNINITNVTVRGSGGLAYGLDSGRSTGISFGNVDNSIISNVTTNHYRAGIQTMASENLTIFDTINYVDSRGIEMGMWGPIYPNYCSEDNYNVSIYDTKFSSCSVGVMISDSNITKVTNNDFANNENLGIDMWKNINNVNITNNYFFNNGDSTWSDRSAIALRYILDIEGNNVIQGNTFDANYKGVYFRSCSNFKEGNGNISIIYNLMINNEYGIHKHADWDNTEIITTNNNRITENTYGIVLEDPCQETLGRFELDELNLSEWDGEYVNITIYDPSGTIGKDIITLPFCTGRNPYILNKNRTSCYETGDNIKIQVSPQCNGQIKLNVEDIGGLVHTETKLGTRRTTTEFDFVLGVGEYKIYGTVECDDGSVKEINPQYINVTNSCPVSQYDVYGLMSDEIVIGAMEWIDENEFGNNDGVEGAYCIPKTNHTDPQIYVNTTNPATCANMIFEIKDDTGNSYSETISNAYNKNIKLNNDWVCYNTIRDVNDTVNYQNTFSSTYVGTTCDNGNSLSFGDPCIIPCKGCGDGDVNISAGEQCDPPTGICDPDCGETCNYCDSSCQNQTVDGDSCGGGDDDCEISDVQVNLYNGETDGSNICYNDSSFITVTFDVDEKDSSGDPKVTINGGNIDYDTDSGSEYTGTTDEITLTDLGEGTHNIFIEITGSNGCEKESSFNIIDCDGDCAEECSSCDTGSDCCEDSNICQGDECCLPSGSLCSWGSCCCGSNECVNSICQPKLSTHDSTSNIVNGSVQLQAQTPIYVIPDECSLTSCNATKDCCFGYCEQNNCVFPPKPEYIFGYLVKPGCAGLPIEPTSIFGFIICDLMWVWVILLSALSGWYSRMHKFKPLPVIIFILPILVAVFTLPYMGIITALFEIIALSNYYKKMKRNIVEKY